MANILSFFSDSKVLVASFALLISIGNFIWTLVNQRKQNRRWDKLNMANVVIKNVSIKKLKSVNTAEARNYDWGYNPIIFVEDFNGQSSLISKLILFDIETKTEISINPCHTINEISQEIQRINYQKEHDIRICIKPTIEFINKGKTDANNLSCEIFFKYGNFEWGELSKTLANITISLEQSTFVEFPLQFPIDKDFELPEIISFKIVYSYINTHSKVIQREKELDWNSKYNTWGMKN